MKVIERMLALNLFTYSLIQLDSKKEKRTFKYMMFQWISMLLIFAIGYFLSMSVESLLIQHTPVNDIAITLSVCILILVLFLFLLSPFVFGYYFNKYATKKLDILYK